MYSFILCVTRGYFSILNIWIAIVNNGKFGLGKITIFWENFNNALGHFSVVTSEFPNAANENTVFREMSHL